MKTRALTSCTGGLICLSTSCTAFVSSTTPALSQHHHHRTNRSPVAAAAAATTPRLLLTPTTMKLSGRARRHARGLRRTRMAEDSGNDGVVNMSSYDAASAPSGPGAGVIELQFENLKTGGFKVFLLFFLLGVSMSWRHVKRLLFNIVTAGSVLCFHSLHLQPHSTCTTQARCVSSISIDGATGYPMARRCVDVCCATIALEAILLRLLATVPKPFSCVASVLQK